MRKLFYLLTTLFIIGLISPIFGQKITTHDTTGNYTLSLAESFKKLREQQMIDSIIRSQISEELKESSGDRKRVRELEERLAVISRNDSIRRAQSEQKIANLRASVKGSPVAPFGDTLFSIFVTNAISEPRERAKSITERMTKLAQEPFYNYKLLKLIETEDRYEIIYDSDMVVMAITDTEAFWHGIEHKVLAKEYFSKIKDSIEKERSENSLKNWTIRSLKIVFIILFLGLIVYSINRMFRKINKFIDDNKEKYLNGITVRNIKLVTPKFHRTLAHRINNILRVVLIVLVVYLTLPLLFSIFPETKSLTDTLLSWIFNPIKAAFKATVHYLPNLFTIIIIFLIFKYMIKAAKFFVDQIEIGEIHFNGFHRDWAQPTFKIVKFLLYAFMIVLIFPYLPGSDSAVFQGVSIFIGVLFSLGSSSAIANMVAGLVITYMRPFKLGDRVKVGEITGDVIDKTLLVTKIRTIKNEEITVPNSTILSSNTVNYSTYTSKGCEGLILNTIVTIGYDVPWKKMEQALVEAALRTEFIEKEPKPFVLQTGLEDFYVSYQINAFTHESQKQAVLYSNLHRNIQDCCNEAGIEILSPHYRAQRDGNQIAIPTDYLPQDYESPAFKVKNS